MKLFTVDNEMINILFLFLQKRQKGSSVSSTLNIWDLKSPWPVRIIELNWVSEMDGRTEFNCKSDGKNCLSCETVVALT